MPSSAGHCSAVVHVSLLCSSRMRNIRRLPPEKREECVSKGLFYEVLKSISMGVAGKKYWGGTVRSKSHWICMNNRLIPWICSDSVFPQFLPTAQRQGHRLVSVEKRNNNKGIICFLVNWSFLICLALNSNLTCKFCLQFLLANFASFSRFWKNSKIFGNFLFEKKISFRGPVWHPLLLMFKRADWTLRGIKAQTKDLHITK